MTQELIRRIDNVVQIGKVCEIKSDKGKALARVDIHGRVTDFLPVFLWNSDFVKVWIPIRIGQQVSVLCPYGNANFGIVLPGIYHKNNKEPEGANEKNIIFEIKYKEHFIRVRIEDSDIFVHIKKDDFTCDFKIENIDIFLHRVKGEHTSDFRLIDSDFFAKLAHEEDFLDLRIEDFRLLLEIIKNQKSAKVTIDEGNVSLQSDENISIRAKKIAIDGEVSISKNLRVAKSIYDELGDLTHHGHPR